MRTDPFNRCVVSGCARPDAEDCWGFCAEHWAKVSEVVRTRLIATFNRNVPGEAYYEALRDAQQEATRERP